MLTCARCGSPATPDAASGLCAGCLLLAGSETFASATFDDLPTVTSHGDGAEAPEGPRLAVGQTWGGYRIAALLGRGGMGEVYEAEHTGSGRRVALKVLRGRLRPADRARFLREGQLAASISHPHTVYIFGSEEIAGMPVITMELLPGGTLKDRVAAEGPLPIEDAVAAVLDIVGGLDAAQASGVLHRDIKPSNCFIDHDGTVKVGDFGLSISTLARDVQAGVGAGGFEGTPQFAPPEQLRGEPLDVRADVYAVGATLYYLLTGRPPFEAADLRELVSRATTEPAVSPRVHRPDVPKALASVVLNCLAKSPVERPPSYAALAEALRPFAPGAHRPASPGIRFVAGLIDAALLAVPAAAVGAWSGVGGPAGAARPEGFLLLIAIQFAYYLVLEGRFGASLGKRLLGLRVRTSLGQPASVSRVALRTLVFLSGGILGGTPAAYGFQPAGTTGFSVQVVPLLILALLFVTIRRRNGWAGLHDLASRTRVVAVREVHRAQAGPASAIQPLPAEPQALRRGPFVVGPLLRQSAEGALRAGFDTQLRRPVWVLDVPADVTLGEPRRDTARPTRLRWLTGKRAGRESWDAFEAPTGAPLLSRLAGPVPWPALKGWLLDLSSELLAAEREGTRPPLAADRLWLRDDGRLVLLDFPAPGLDGDFPVLTPVGLIADVVRRVGGEDGPGAAAFAWPLGARRLFERLASPSPPPLDMVRDDLLRVSASLDSVARWRRAIPALLAAAPAVVLGVAALAVLPTLTAIGTPETMNMLGWLAELRREEGQRRVTDEADRAALERYVAGRYRAELTDDAFWNTPVARALSELHEAGLAAMARHPDVTDAEVAQLAARLAPHLSVAEATARARADELAQVSRVVILALSGIALAVAFVCALLSALAVPGGLLSRLLGLAVVGRDGREIGRGRSIARVLVAWSPVLVWFAYVASAPRADGWVPVPAYPLASLAVLFVVMAASLCWLLARPARGLHDRMLGTTVVPR